MKRTEAASKKWLVGMFVAVVAIAAGFGIPAKNGCGGGDAEHDGTGTTTVQGLQAPGLTVVSTSISPRVTPGGSLAVSITVKNISTTTWQPGTMKLAFTSDGGWTNSRTRAIAC